MKLWIARDKDGKAIGKGKAKGRLFLYATKPIKSYSEEASPIWVVDENSIYSYFNAIEIDSNEFPEVTFENSPQEVELNIKSK